MPMLAMQRLMVSGDLRLSFAHRPCIGVQQRQVFIRPINSNSQLHWGKRQTWKRLVSTENPNAENPFDDRSRDEEAILEKIIDDSESPMLSAEKLNELLLDTGRKQLVKRLSEANQNNRFLKRQLQCKDVDLANLKSDLATLDLELQDLVGLAEEVANLEVQPGTRKVNGEYIQSHLLSCLKGARGKLQQKIEGVELIKSQDVTLSWVGMAERVQVMGSFDGWSQGVEMSPEYDGGYNKFAATLHLRPGRYEVKFLIDGQWQLSPELPTVGEGVMQNNLLIV